MQVRQSGNCVFTSYGHERCDLRARTELHGVRGILEVARLTMPLVRVHPHQHVPEVVVDVCPRGQCAARVRRVLTHAVELLHGQVEARVPGQCLVQRHE